MNIFLPTKLRTNKWRCPNRTVFFLFCRNSHRPVYSHHFLNGQFRSFLAFVAKLRETVQIIIFLTLLRRTGPAAEVCKTATVLQLVGIIFLMTLLPRSVLVCTISTMLAVGTMERRGIQCRVSTLPSTTISDRNFLSRTPLFHHSQEQKFPHKMRKIPPADR